MKTIKRLVVSMLLLFSLNAHAQSEVETLLGFTADDEGLHFHVVSTGCTNKDSFDLQILESHPVQLRLDRETQDLCEVVPHEVSILYTWEEINLSGIRYFVVNPFRSQTILNNN